MMKNNIFYLILFLCLICAFFNVYEAKGQKNIIIYGNISSQERTPIASVNITLKKADKDSSILSFAFSDAKGGYQIQLSNPSDSIYHLSAFGLGYNSENALIHIGTKNKIEKNFILVSKPLVLNEVVIKQAIPVKVKQDTIIYNTKAFSDGSEQSLEDLLKKLPRVKVSENGDITVKGKQIEKITIEGEDFFNKNYKVISKNINPKVIASIEAIDNYTDNPLLREVEKSGKIMLNLTVKEKNNKFAFGNLSVEGGNKQKYELRSNIFSLFGKVKGAFIGDMNNIGNDPVDEANTANGTNEKNKKLDSYYAPLSSSISSPTFSIPEMNQKKYFFNNSKLGSGSIGFTPHKNLKINFYYYRYTDKIEFKSQTTSSYFLPDSLLTLQDSSISTKKPIVNNANFRVDYFLKNKFNLRFISNIKDSKITENQFIYTKSTFFSEDLSSSLYSNYRLFSNNLTLTYKIKDRSIIVFDLINHYEKLPQNLTILSNRFAFYYDLNKNYNKISQLINNKISYDNVSIQWKTSNEKSNFMIGLNTFSSNSIYNSNLSLVNKESNLLQILDSVGNNSNYVRRTFSIEGSLTSRLSKRIRFVTSGSITTNQLSYTGVKIDNTNKSYINFISGLKYDFSEESKGYLFYTQIQTPPKITDLFSNYILTSYRSFSKGYGSYNFSTLKILSFNYAFVNWHKLSNLFINCSILQEKQPYINFFDVQGLLTFQTGQPFIGNNHEFNFSIDFDKYITQTSTNIKASISASRVDIRNGIDMKNIDYNQLQSIMADLRVVFSYKSKVNFELGNKFTYSSLNYSNKDKYSSFLTLRPKSILKVYPLKSLIIIFSGEYFNWKNSGLTNSSFLLDGNMQYNPNKSKYSFGLTFNNLLNSKRVYNTQLSNFLITNRVFNIQPQFISAQVQIGF